MKGILDVGCGDKPRGNINCDVERQDVQNFVKCDAQHLPFKNNSFSVVSSFDVIEHVDDPILMVKELFRVATNHVEIRTPHVFSYSARGLPIFSRFTGFTYHKHVWTRNYWKILLSNFKNVLIKVKPNLRTEFWWVPFKSIEIIVEVQK